MDLSKFTMPKIRELKSELNLTTEEDLVFDMLAKHKSIVEIADTLRISEPTVSRRIRRIKDKIRSLENYYG